MSPFVWIRGRLWVASNWEDGMPTDAWLLLRPATPAEKDHYLAEMAEADAGAFYTSVLVDEDRFRGRRDGLLRG